MNRPTFPLTAAARDPQELRAAAAVLARDGHAVLATRYRRHAAEAEQARKVLHTEAISIMALSNPTAGSWELPLKLSLLGWTPPDQLVAQLRDATETAAALEDDDMSLREVRG